MSTSYTTAIGRIQEDVLNLQSSVGYGPWKVTPYQCGVASGSPLAITPTDLFGTLNTNKNEIYYFMDDTPNLTGDTIVNVDYSSRPENSIVIFNGTAQNLIITLTISGTFASSLSSAPLVIKNLNTLESSTIIPGEAVTFYIQANKDVYFFPGIVQLASPSAINNPLAVTNLVISTGAGTSQQVLTWTEIGNVVSRVVISLTGGITIVNQGVGSAELTLENTGNVTIRITISDGSQSAYAEINLSNPCFLGRVKLLTSLGAIEAKDIKIGMEMIQPDNSKSKVMQVKRSTVAAPGNNFENDRLFADAEEKMVVTYWHKIRFIDEEEEIKAGSHPKLHEVQEEFPFDVYNFALEHFTHKIMLADVPVIAESFVPVNPK